MATLYESDNIRYVINEPKEIEFFTNETSISAINYSTIDEMLASNGIGLKGISFWLSDSNYEWIYGNKNAIALPTEIGSSVSGILTLIGNKYHPNV